MKKLISTSIQILVILFFVVPIALFPACEPNDCDEEPQPCDSCAVVYKPNIYIYPDQELQIEVSLSFPQGGQVIASIPTYNEGWNVSVSPNGKIDDKYDFLFYESEQPNVWQTSQGWCIPKTNLESFFTQNMTEYGFEDNEIDDFIEYWIPRWENENYYAIYPQNKEIIESVIALHLSETPDNILRRFYLVKEVDINISNNLTIPEIETFNRNGFVVAEWGVVL